MEQLKEFMLKAWDWLNEPLPIISVSVLFISFFAWRVFKSTKFGKKQLVKMENRLTQWESTLRQKEQELTKLKDEIIEKNKELEKHIIKHKEIIIKICETIPNKKVKAIAEKVKDNGEK